MTTLSPFGFTLPELLVALLILAEIATFTIPKLLATQQSQQKAAAAKETIGTMSDAYLLYKNKVGVSPGTSLDYELFQYISYVKWDTLSQLDNYPLFSGPVSCTTLAPCIRLHNGGLLKSSGASWYDTNTTSGVGFIFDPDGAYTGANDSLTFTIYTDGGVRTRATLRNNSTSPGPVVRGPQAGGDPTWFSW